MPPLQPGNPHPGMQRLNEIEAMAKHLVEYLAPATHERWDGSETIEASPNAIAEIQVASDIQRLVDHIKSDPVLLERMVRVLSR